MGWVACFFENMDQELHFVKFLKGFHSSAGQSVRLLTSRPGVRAALGAFR